MTKTDIEMKMGEIIERYIADDEYLVDALMMCLDEVRALITANSIDDKLAMRDALVKAIESSFISESALRIMATTQLEAEYLADNPPKLSATQQAYDDAGVKDSDF